jgi:S-adenosylmethionine:tRNA ribosyltransferase-isomerase
VKSGASAVVDGDPLDAADTLDFVLPPALEATAPAEAVGAGRDDVRLLVAYRRTGELVDTVFDALPDFLTADDLLVINTSGTLPAALDAVLSDGTPVVVHLSTHLGDDMWALELRGEGGASPWTGGVPDGTLRTAGGGRITLHGPFLGSARLRLGRLDFPQPALAYLARHGRPIRYGYVHEAWPIDAYQTVWATEPGSAEMPSASRPFTPEMVARLVARGVGFAPVLLHTGVASLESHEPPYPEFFRVPEVTARRVHETRAAGGRIIAIGTTAVRAIESAVDDDGTLRAAHGWTDLVVTPARGVHIVDGLLSGWHEPKASHLQMLEAVAGRPLLEASYERALRDGYRWHEFGDVHLMLP